jgi:hypothetical protein
MRFFLILAALLLPLGIAQDFPADSTITVLSTTLITITSCHPTVTNCPGRNQPAASSSAQVVVASQPSLLPSSSSSLQLSPSSSRLGPTSCPKQRCNADNCLRALERGQAQQFCHSFTQRVVTDTAGLPSYTTQCTGSTISRVSSACSCLNNACIGTSSATVQSLSPGCNADNCLRALERDQAQQFCHTFTQSVVTDTAGLPSYTTQCTGSTIARVSSACSCLNSNLGSGQPTFTLSGSVISSMPSSTQSVVVPVSASQLSASSAQVLSFTTVSTNSQGSPATSVIQATLVPSPAAPSSVAATQPRPPQSQSGQVFSFTTVGTNSQGSLVTSVIQATLAPSSFLPQPSSLTSVFTNAQGNTLTSVIPAPPTMSQSAAVPSTQPPPQVFSFTTTGTNAQGSTFSSVVVGTFTPSSVVPQPVASSIAPSQPAQSSGVGFSFTTTGTDAQGSPFSTVVQGTFIPSSSGAPSPSAAPSLQPFSFTTTGTDAQGNPFTTVVQGNFTPSALASIVPGPGDVPFTSAEVGTDSHGNPFTSLFTGFGSLFTSTSTGIDAHGTPFTSLFTGIAPAPGGSFTGFSFPTGIPPTPGPSLSFPEPTNPPSSNTLPCLLNTQPFPTCLFPPATSIPSTCFPFPECLLTAIPSSVQNELSSNCGTTPILSCILEEPNVPCTLWPLCLSQAVGTDICDGFPFPDCLFTLYSPTVTSTITTDPPGLTTISTSNTDWTKNTLYQTTDSNGDAVWWPVFINGPGCPECGVVDWILGNLPLDLFNIKFTLPGFPHLPEFHLPVSECFLLFIH